MTHCAAVTAARAPATNVNHHRGIHLKDLEAPALEAYSVRRGQLPPDRPIRSARRDYARSMNACMSVRCEKGELYNEWHQNRLQKVRPIDDNEAITEQRTHPLTVSENEHVTDTQ